MEGIEPCPNAYVTRSDVAEYQSFYMELLLRSPAMKRHLFAFGAIASLHWKMHWIDAIKASISTMEICQTAHGINANYEAEAEFLRRFENCCNFSGIRRNGSILL